MRCRRSTESTKGALSVGYVNINGLAGDKWEPVIKLLHSSFDFLFLAETWYVGHQRRCRDRRFVASTVQPVGPSPKSRSGGGIYLLATESARALVCNEPVVTERSITFEALGLTIAGIYLQPSLSLEEVNATLDTVSHSAVILGDVNTRFPWLQSQAGKPGPPDRVATFRRFSRTSGHRLLGPVAAPADGLGRRTARTVHELTVDHCLMQAAGPTARLTLVDNTSVGLRTDHRYTLCLHLDLDRKSRELSHTSAPLRYRVGLLAKAGLKDKVCMCFEEEAKTQSDLNTIDDPSRLNDLLVGILQRVCEGVLGRSVKQSPHQKSRQRLSPCVQDPATSALLYKAAAAESKENGVIVPSSTAQQQGVDAMSEITSSFVQRFTSESLARNESAGDSSLRPPLHDVVDFTFVEGEVKKEIAHQDPNKACGGDGIHVRLLQALMPSSLPRILCRLFNLCLTTGRVPPAWKLTDIHLLTKDIDQPRDVHNLRPITLVCMHRKIFERLLLTKYFDHDGWARLHPTQAGFRGDYSTLTNAALLHHLMATRSIRYALFVDLEKAFDMVDHARLASLLRKRGCPRIVYTIINGLTFQGVRSRVFVNGQPSAPFPRTRGVLQGSPISPVLFNIYIDDLACRLNDPTNAVPRGIFYADDGVLLANDVSTLQKLVDILAEWSAEAKIRVNVKKCGLLTNRTVSTPVNVHTNGVQIPPVTSYMYLGFPIKAGGIDFEEHLRYRLLRANGRTAFLRLHSDDWGPAHRLRVYHQYLAPMFEYGAALVAAWAEQSPANYIRFNQAVEGWKDLVSWIVSCDRESYGLAASLCGLAEPTVRFSRLKTAYQRQLGQTRMNNPLHVAMSRLPVYHTGDGTFLTKLKNDRNWKRFKMLGDKEPTTNIALGRFLRTIHMAAILKDANSRHLTRLTIESRSSGTLFMADTALLASVRDQQAMVRYRMGRFMYGSICVCSSDRRFHRGHERCPDLPQPAPLSKKERRQKKTMARRLLLDRAKNFTDIDFLLNTRQFARVGQSLTAVRKALNKSYSDNMAAESPNTPMDELVENERLDRKD